MAVALPTSDSVYSARLQNKASARVYSAVSATCAQTD